MGTKDEAIAVTMALREARCAVLHPLGGWNARISRLQVPEQKEAGGSSSRDGSPMERPMRGEGFLGAVCILLIAAGGTAFALGDEGAKPPRTPPGGVSAPDARRAPRSKAPEESGAAQSKPAGICEPGASPVMIVVVDSPERVKSVSALWKGTPTLVEEADTVVFADGRVVTSRVEAAGDHLQSLGWAHRQIEIVGGLPAASGAWQRRRG
jgi:hypothetical protein